MGTYLSIWLRQAVFVLLVVENIAFTLLEVFEQRIVEQSLLIYVLLGSYLSFHKITLQWSGIHVEAVVVILFEVKIKPLFFCARHLRKVCFVARVEALIPNFQIKGLAI